jgi:hypothetical protein
MSLLSDLVSGFRPRVVWRAGEPVDHNKLNRMMDGFVRLITVGPGLRKVESPDGSQVAIGLEPRTTPANPGRWIWLTAASQEPEVTVGPDTFPVYRWTYDFAFAAPSSAAKWPGWEDGETSADKAYSTAEVPNVYNATTYGNGVVASDLPDGFTLQPVTTPMPVWATPRVTTDEDDNLVTEWWFSFPNGVSGTCDTGGE